MIKKLKLSYKYIRLFIILVIVPVFLIQTFFNWIYVKSITDKTSELTDITIRQLSYFMEENIKNLSITASSIVNDAELMKMLELWRNETNGSLKLQHKNKISSKIYSYINYLSNIEGVYIFYTGQGLYNLNLSNEEEIRNAQWYTETVENVGTKVKYILAPSLSNDNKRYTAIAISPKNIINNDIELILIYLNSNTFGRWNSTRDDYTMDEFYLIDQDGNILESTNRSLLYKNISDMPYLQEPFLGSEEKFTYSYDGKTYFSVSTIISKTGWKLLNIVNYSSFSKSNLIISTYFLWAIVLILCVFLLFFYFMYRDIAKPIGMIIEETERVKDGAFHIKNIEINILELHLLYSAFKDMLQKINQLINEKLAKERERVDLEIKFLQSQINPHFLYNTLNTVRILASISKNDNIKNILDSLIRLLGATFGKGGEVCSISEEIDYLKDYINIMRFRHGSIFVVKYKMEPETEACIVPKLILQPIVENALIHGLSEDDGVILIKSCIVNDVLQIIVCDNGKGISDATLNKLREESKSSTLSSIGFSNVRDRVRLNYGNEYGVNIETKEGFFTKVTIRLPIRHC